MDTAVTKPKYTTGEIIDKFIEIRDYVEKETKQFEDKIRKYKENMAKMEVYMLKRLTEEGQQSAKSAAGNTCFRVTKTSVKINDKEKWLDFIYANWSEAPSMITAHIAKEGVLDYLSREDRLPAGVDMTNILAVQFRKG